MGFGRWWSRLLGRVDCSQVRALASDYLDGSLSRNKSQRIQAHLAWCRPCQAFLASLEATILLLRGLQKEKAPKHLRRRVGALGGG